MPSVRVGGAAHELRKLGLTPDAFRKWWGPSRIKTNTQIIAYTGPALSLSSLGDGIVLWNSGATEDFDSLVSEVFSTATLGVSFGYDPDTQTFGDLDDSAGAQTVERPR